MDQSNFSPNLQAAINRDEAATQATIGAYQALRSAAEERLSAKEALDVALAEARHSGQIEGKNEADREAHARMLLGDYYERVNRAEIAYSNARINLDAALTESSAARFLTNLEASFGSNFPNERAN